MADPLLEELVKAEDIWRTVIYSQEPLFADMPVERVDPDPNHHRHWFFATDDEKIMAHVYKPDYVQQKFKDVVAPLFKDAYGFSVDVKNDEKREILADYLVHHTFTYLLFHELFHPKHVPKSKDDQELIDVALKNGIKRAEPYLSARDLINKTGNVKNAVWDLLIDTFFSHYLTNGSPYETKIRKEITSRDEFIDGHQLEMLPDGIITTWDIVELADHDPQTLFFPLTREIYSLLACNDETLRNNVFDYFKNKIGSKMDDAELEQVITQTLTGVVKYLGEDELAQIGVNKQEYVNAVSELYSERGQATGSAARKIVVKGITDINTRTELRYRSIEGIIEPLAPYIDVNKEERRDGAYTEGQEGSGDQQTPTTHSGGGAESVLQSLINQNDPDLNQMLASIANDQSAPQTNRNIRISNLSKDEYYKRNARELPVRSPTIEAETIEVGKLREPVKVGERLLTLEELSDLPWDDIMQFQQETGILSLIKLSDYQWRHDIYEWQERPIIDFEYRKSGIILPENIIFRVDGSGSMTSTDAFVGKQNRYDSLMHVVYGITKSVAKAAKSVNKEINVVGVSFSNDGDTRVSEAVELQTFYDSPNNSAKQVLLNPQQGQTYHDLPAYQEAHRKCKPGKTIEIIVTDGDLYNDHDASLREVGKILDVKENAMLYFPIFEEGAFARRISSLSHMKPNLTYKPFLTFAQLQSEASGFIIQYKQSSM